MTPTRRCSTTGRWWCLTSRHSASASEIVAGALQDYGRALIVGDSSTHGKGTVQSVNQLRPLYRSGQRSLTNDPGALKLTIKKFFRPSGASTQLKGVVPDIVLPSVANESKDIGESALDNPLPVGHHPEREIRPASTWLNPTWRSCASAPPSALPPTRNLPTSARTSSSSRSIRRTRRFR